MVSLVLAASFFVGIHVFISGTPVRGAIVGRIGEQAFRGLFSLLSLVGLVWMCFAYARAPLIPLWGAVAGLHIVALGVTLLAVLFVTIGLATPSPTVVGGEQQLDAPEPAQGILRITRHPFLWGVALWALMHFLLNGDAASAVLFGALLVLALVGPRSIDAKRRRAFGERWERFVGVTSNVPFAAIAQGRNTLRVAELGWTRIAVAVVVYGLILVSHEWLFGASPFP
jgi:uncharacterized membrane protein